MSRGLVMGLGLAGGGTLLLLALLFVDSAPPPTTTPAAPAPRAPVARTPRDTTPLPDPSPTRVTLAPHAELPDGEPDIARQIQPIQGYPPSGRYGQQADDDRLKLGQAAYLDLERLWSKGVRPRGNPASMKALEELLEKYPDSWRAGCAAYELGLHHLRSGQAAPAEREAQGQKYLELARSRYPKSRCDGDAAAEHMADLALALDVYRNKDRNRALTILEEMQGLPPNETDPHGTPLRERARKIRETIFAGAAPR
ncbi:MAG: hypothetical protein HY904_20660 [Deltaproteobacteria bacterium]|nr:hypothetical protein [Deltaproteobacteria bacterium]